MTSIFNFPIRTDPTLPKDTIAFVSKREIALHNLTTGGTVKMNVDDYENNIDRGSKADIPIKEDEELDKKLEEIWEALDE